MTNSRNDINVVFDNEKTATKIARNPVVKHEPKIGSNYI